jgi:hypothetical protein
MAEDSRTDWIRGGALASLALAAAFALFRRWRLARIAAAFAAAFAERWRDDHLGAGIRDLIAKAGRNS